MRSAFLLALLLSATTAFAQDAPASLTEGVPDAVRLEGTPAIPDGLSARLAQYLETRSASLASISNDGERMLISTRFGEIAQLHEVRMPLGARTQLTFFDEPLRSASYAPNDPMQLFYLRDAGGAEDYQLFSYDRRTGEERAWTEPGARVSSYTWDRSGAWIAYSTNQRNGTDTDVWMLDVTGDGGAQILTEREGSWYTLGLSRGGDRALVMRYISVTATELQLIDRQTGAVTPLSEDEAYYSGAIAPDGETVYLLTDAGAEFRQLYAVPVSGEEPGARALLSADIPWNVESVVVAPDGRSLAFMANEDGFSRLYLYDIEGDALHRADALPRGVMYGLNYAPDAASIGFTLSGATTNGDVFRVDVSDPSAPSFALTRWTESEVGGLDPSGFVEPELVRYASFDGLEVPAFVYRPREAEGPAPVFVSIHGGPESQARPYFSSFYQFLLGELGVAVIVPNVRGSNGYGKTYVAMDNGMAREDSVRDIGALLDWIASDPGLDESRVGVFGDSYGGYMVMASLMHYSDRLAAGVQIVGISNFVTFLENTRDYRRDLRRVEYGDERDPEMRAHLEEISPTNNVARMTAPLFVAQGANDPRVPASEAEQIVEAMRGAGHDVWYMLAENEGHGFRRKENRDLFYALTALFFDTHVVR